ncbi:filamentous hemagglutinin N-terminal domain-containing protein [Gammaproteobacteria bacterium]|nr:filamentous hemagglutinin N-terminal domain-containing protein [Gammaproteobacteria bacterium]
MKKILLIIISAFSSFFFMAAFANPVVAPGGFNPNQVQINQQDPNHTIVNQSNQKTVIQWNKFNIQKHETTTFRQPNQSSVVINRINPTNGISEIFGKLNSNGRIVLINQAGIIFGPSAIVNVGGIIASTSDITRFNDEKYIFDIPSKYPNASVINRGTIRAADYGLVALIGNRVENTGNITAHAGTVIMGSGNKFTLDFTGNQLLNFTIDEEASATVTAEDVKSLGRVQVAPAAAQKILDNVVNNTGIKEATNFAKASNGDLIFSDGKIDVSATKPGQKGGKVKLLASNIKVKNATIDASGDAGGGEVLIGGNYQGKGPEFNATNTSIEGDTLINANAINNGDGGKVIVWANNNTFFDGTILAQGGALSGDGGLVETSGKNLNFGSNLYVNTQANNGKTGSWLLDPEAVFIDNGPTSPGYNPSLDPNDPVFADVSLNAADLSNWLSTTNVTVLAISEIVLLDDVTITIASGRKLTLEAPLIDLFGFDLNINGGEAIFDRAVENGGFNPSILSITGAATFNSSIGGGISNISLDVTGNLNLKSDNIDISGNTITGGGGTLTLGSLSIDQTVTLNNSSNGGTFTSSFTGNPTITFSNFNGVNGPIGSTIILPDATNELVFQPLPKPIEFAVFLNGTNPEGLNGFQFNSGFRNITAIMGTSNLVDLTRVQVNNPLAAFSNGVVTYSIGDPIDVTFTNFTSNNFILPEATNIEIADPLIVGINQAEDAVVSAEDAKTSSETNKTMLQTATDAIDAAYGDTEFGPENSTGGCGAL